VTEGVVFRAAGDLVYHWGVDVSRFTLLGADLQTRSADQYLGQPTATAITPTFAHTWASVAMARRNSRVGRRRGSLQRVIGSSKAAPSAPTGLVIKPGG
jgi:hypothetical protein